MNSLTYKPKGTQKSHKKRLTVKQHLFVKELVKSKGNGTVAALEAYNTDDPVIAKSIASENLSKPYILNAVHEAFSKQGLSLEKVLSIHARNLTQEDNLKVSQQAVKDYYQVTKMVGSEGEKGGNVNIAIVIED